MSRPSTPDALTALSGDAAAPLDDGAAVTPEAPGRYSISGERGRGGQSVVMVAFDAHMGREIAFKQLLGEASPARFLREARIAARLEHPNIVPVYELGRRADGSLYAAQKLVRGRTLRAALGECADLAARLRLLPNLLAVSQAVAYAHSRGVLHRDLKPENVMVGEFGETVLLDWGLARLTGQPDVEVTLPSGAPQPSSPSLTLAGAAMGTPAYMSPEQARGDVAAVDERSDVWSLGAMLFELLTGAPPFDGLTAHEIVAQVIEREPPDPRALSPGAPADLCAVVRRALQRAQTARYPGAAAFASELEAWQAGRRVAAHEYGSLELVRKFVARNRAVSALAGLALLLVLAVALQAARGLAEARRTLSRAYLSKAREAQRERRWAEAQRWFAESATHDPGAAPTIRLEAGIDWSELVPLTSVEGHTSWISAVAFSPDGKLLASSGWDEALLIRDAATGAELRRLQLEAVPMVGALAFSPAGVLVCGLENKALLAWDAATGRAVARLTLPANAQSLSFSRDGKRLAVAGTDDRFGLYEVSDAGLSALPGPRQPGRFVDFSPDGLRIASAVYDKEKDQQTLRMFEVAALEHPSIVASGQKGLSRPHFLPDGTLVLASNGMLAFRDPATMKEVATIDRGLVTSALAVSRDGRQIAVGGRDRAWLFDARTREELATIPLPAQALALDFSADGGELALGVRAPALLRWRVRARLAASLGQQRDFSFVPGTHQLLVVGDDRTVLFDGDSGAALARSEVGGFRIARPRVRGPLAILGGDGAVDLLDPASLARRRLVPPSSPRNGVALADDGSVVFTAEPGESSAWNPATGARLWRAAGQWAGGLSLDARGDRLVLRAFAGSWLLDARTGAEIARLPLVAEGLDFLDAQTAVLGSVDGRLSLVDLPSGRVVRQLSAQGSTASFVALSPAARLGVLTGLDGLVRVWDTAEWQPITQLTSGGNEFVAGLNFSSDGRLLAFVARSTGLGVIRFTRP